VKILQGSSAETATAAGLSTATLKTVIGSTVAGTVQSAQSAIINVSSGKNGGTVGETVVINGVTLTVASTVLAEAYTLTQHDSTLGTFGSSLLSTVDLASELIAKGLKNLINSTYGSSVFTGGLGAVFQATTLTYSASTEHYQVRVAIKDDSELTSALTIVGSTGFEPVYQTAHVALAFNTAQLPSTSKYVTLNFSTVGGATALQYTVVAIKEGCRYSPTFQGNYVLALNATDVKTSPGATAIA
jgi:hypothetical protein